ncbi:MAG TPA: CBS domain-containing protein [Candidatus Nanoarchaeia archaeon]|nr:CBS domain-containing protein [Candidatus Nanoarchaeia archaeon]
MEVREIMSKAVVTDDKATLRDAARIMSDKNIGSLIVVVNNVIKGILTERDVMKNINKLDNKITSIMSKRVITIDAYSDVQEAVKIMTERRIKRIPVLKDKKLVGLISMTDLIAYSDVEESDFFLN